MLPAKLFGALCLLSILFVFAGAGLRFSAIDLYLGETYIVLNRWMIPLAAALVCAIFALAYFAASRSPSLHLNSLLGVIHFALTAIGIVLPGIAISNFGPVAYVASGRVVGEPAMSLWPGYALGAGAVREYLYSTWGLCSFASCDRVSSHAYGVFMQGTR